MGLKPIVQAHPSFVARLSSTENKRRQDRTTMTASYSPSFFQHFPKYHAPHLHKGEEMKDPLEDIKPRCLTSCGNWLAEYNNCVHRISMRTDGKGDCKGQFEELCQCQDHCIAHEIFSHLK